MRWNHNILILLFSYDDYPTTQEGTKILAANCMLIEAIGEGIIKIRGAVAL